MATIQQMFGGAIDQAGGAALSSSWNAFLQTPTGQSMLTQVEQRAKSGIEQAAGHNALNLMAFALAGGAIGAAVFKGPIGILAALGIAAWAGNEILKNPTGEAKQPQPVQGLGRYERNTLAVYGSDGPSSYIRSY